MSLRLTPEIRFVFDDSIERSERVRQSKFLQRFVHFVSEQLRL